MRQRLKQAENQAIEVGRDRNKLRGELDSAKNNAPRGRDRRDDSEFDELQRQMKGLRSELDSVSIMAIVNQIYLYKHM